MNLLKWKKSFALRRRGEDLSLVSRAMFAIRDKSLGGGSFSIKGFGSEEQRMLIMELWGLLRRHQQLPLSVIIAIEIPIKNTKRSQSDDEMNKLVEREDNSIER